MFEGFAQVWVPLIEARRVRAAPLRVGLAGEALVLFRGKGGKIGALIDRCPHRGAALSLGKVGADGCLECPFHGWRFDTDGANRHTPLNPDAKRDQLGAVPVPVREIGDMIWVHTGPAPLAEPVAPDGLSDPKFARLYLERIWACHWTRAMENMLDRPHLPFVHRRTIGRGLRQRMTPASRMEVDWEETPWGGYTKALLDGVDGGGLLEFYKPNIMALHIPVPGRHLRIHAIATPIDRTSTRLTLVTSRDFARIPFADALFARANRRIAEEDRAIVESSQPPEAPPPGQERSVRTDRATLAFRKYYYDTLRPSRAA